MAITEAFVAELQQRVERGRVDKALAMLRADRFQLFAKADDAALAGVVRSQHEEGLVYACRLTATGEFACCTQNLNPCGGLRGAPCKHLLVLIVGLVQKGVIAQQRALDWLAASAQRAPFMEGAPAGKATAAARTAAAKEVRAALGEFLLEYNGAQAGSIDWRPAETIPEDFYLA